MRAKTACLQQISRKQAFLMRPRKTGRKPYILMQTEVVPHADIERIFTQAHWPERSALREAFLLNRRRSDRWSVPGTASLLTLGESLGLLTDLHTLSGSPWWLAGYSATAVPAGMRVSIGFSDPAGRSASGTVMRCEGFGERQFRIALRFD